MHPCDEEQDHPGYYIRGASPATFLQDDALPIESNSAFLTDEGGRDGDLGDGRILQPGHGQPLSQADRDALEAFQRRDAESKARRLMETEISTPQIVHLPSLLLHPLVGAIFVGAAAILTFLLLSQTLSALAALATLPPWQRYFGWVILALLGGSFLYAVGRFTVFYLTLRLNRQVNIRGLKRLARRTHLRHVANKTLRETKLQLERYLKEYSLDSERDQERLAELGGLDVDQLRGIRDDLLDPSRFASYGDWFDSFRTRFQGVLEDAADRRIRHYARRVGLVTAASPNALVDTVVASYCGFLMLTDLCRIYNLRVGKFATTILLTRVFFNSYVAGQLHESETITDAGFQSIVQEIAPHIGTIVVDTAPAKLFGKLGSRAARGAANYVMLTRLGRCSAGLLRPVDLKQQKPPALAS